MGTPVELALGKPATADSSQTSPAHPPAAGNDGSLNTRWTAADALTNHFWTVDLGAAHSVTGSEVTWEFGQTRYGYVIEVSTDNANFQTALDRTTNTKLTQTQSEVFSAQARWVRIRVTALTTTPQITWASFFEFKVFGT